MTQAAVVRSRQPPGKRRSADSPTPTAKREAQRMKSTAAAQATRLKDTAVGQSKPAQERWCPPATRRCSRDRS